MSPIRLSLISALTLCAWVDLSLADPSEVMIVLDASSSMQFVPGADRLPTGCVFPRGGAPSGLIDAEDPDASSADYVTRFHLVQDALAAHVSDARCIGHGPTERHEQHIMGEDGAFPHFRRTCRNSSGVYVPCGKDHGRNRGAPDPDQGGASPATLSNSGFLTDDSGATYQDIAFGLMVSDSNPMAATSNRQAAKDWSYGDERYQPPTLAPASLPPGQEDRIAVNLGASALTLAEFNQPGLSSVARAPWLGADPELSYLETLSGQPMNLGVMGDDAPAGRMIFPNIGIKVDTARMLNGEPLLIQQHNDWVRDELQRVVPTGPSPLSAMLADLRSYYEQANHSGGCSKRVAVLVTDGAESTYLPLHRCQNDRDCAIGDQVGKCQNTRHRAFIHHERMTVNTGSCAHQSCSRVCVFPTGYPYPSPIESARALHDELGVPLIVATVGLPDAVDYIGNLDDMPPALQHAYLIAEAGSPNLGPREGMPGIYSISALRTTLKGGDLIERVSGQRSGGVRLETQPLVMSSTQSDAPWLGEPQADLRQWRLASAAVSPSGDDRSYGVIESNLFGCRGARANRAGLVSMGQVHFESKVAAQGRRPAFTLHHNGGAVQGVIDTASPLFLASGAPLGTEYQNYLHTPSAEVAQAIALQAGGFFGARAQEERRSFGANINGDLIALPPRPDEATPANEAAPTLVINGGDDGLVHVFRAFDGYELFAFIPRRSWEEWSDSLSPQELHVDAPLNAAYLSECRLGDGGGRCLGTLSTDFRPVVIGSAGLTARELYGFELGFTPAQLRQADPNLLNWPSEARAWSVTHATPGADKLGLAVSRPTLTHVRVNGQTRGVAIVGCGDDESSPYLSLPNQVGRCLLFIDAFTGEVLHTLKGTDLTRFTFPVIGSPSVYPGGDVAAEQVYVGDKVGQLWRVDLVGDDPTRWSLTRIWPVDATEQVPEELTRGLGFGVSERPSLALAPNNDRVVIFGTSGDAASALPPPLDVASRGYMVSLRERKALDVSGRARYQVSVNWVLDYAPNESMTGAPKIKDSVVYFSSVRPTNAEVCGQAAAREGRLYGVHFMKSLREPYQDNLGSRELNVVPMLPRYKASGERGDNALSLILPPGKTAHGFAVVPTPSCTMEIGTVTELVLNLSDEGGGSALQLNGLQVEYVQGMGSEPGAPVGGPVTPGIMALQRADLEQSMQVQMSGQVMNVALAPPSDAPVQSVVFNPASPFPSKVLYWGGAYGQ